MTKEELELERLINVNKENIAFNRVLTVIIALLIVALIGIVGLKVNHSLHDCENRLFLKLMEESRSEGSRP